MFPAIFAIFAFSGAIAAIRRNPSYTGRSLLRSLPIILLAIAAVAGTIIAAVHFTANRSSGVILTVIIACCIFGCFFLVYVSYSVSTPKDARLTHTLPPGTVLLNIHRQRVYRWTKFSAVTIAVLAALKLLLPGNFGFAALFTAAFALFIAALLLPIFYFTSRMMDVSLTALQADPWVHWTYTPEQWQQWSEVQVARLQTVPPTPVQWGKLAWMLLAVAAGLYLFAPGGLLWKAVYLLSLVALLALLLFATRRGTRTAPANLRAQLSAASPEVYFGHDGLFVNGAYTTWRSNDVFLNSATIDDHTPRSLLFCFERDVPNPYGPLSVIPVNQAVLIPAGKEHDLAVLQQKLTERCPQAQINLA